MAPPPRPAATQRPITDIEEADILLNPATGLLWTTMQYLKQRPLPGHVARSPMRERLSALAQRYDRLIVLISQGSIVVSHHTPSSGPTGEVEQRALQQLRLFTTSLKGSTVRVEYIAGGEIALAQTIVREMAAHADGKWQGELAEQESLAELELRHAGLNAYAALVVLAELNCGERDCKTMSDEDKAEALVRFVNMSHVQRVGRFEGLLGGRRALDRIEGELRRVRG